MPALVNVMKEEASLVTLVKPQFEARRSQVRNSYCCVYFNISGGLRTQVSVPCSDMKLFQNIFLMVHINIVFTIFLSCISTPF